MFEEKDAEVNMLLRLVNLPGHSIEKHGDKFIFFNNITQKYFLFREPEILEIFEWMRNNIHLFTSQENITSANYVIDQGLSDNESVTDKNLNVAITLLKLGRL